MATPDPSERIPGFVPALVKDNQDPLALGRIKVLIPNLIEPMSPFWVMPAGWPGAGGEKDGAFFRGSQYPPPPIDAQVYVMFEQGRWDDPETSAIYLPAMYGLKDGEKVGPDAIYDAPTSEEANRRACIWEDENFSIYVADDDDEKILVLQTKLGGSVIEIDANAGANGKSEVISIEAQSGLNIFSKGLVDIRGAVVQIQGRRVVKGGKGI
jgi:hypothetical protein